MNDISRCILNALKPLDVIDIDSDNDVDMMEVDTSNIGQWKASLLQKIERRYPDVYDAVIKVIMSSQDDDSSSLKAALGKQHYKFLFVYFKFRSVCLTIPFRDDSSQFSSTVY